MLPMFSKQAKGVDALTKSIKGLTIEQAIEKMTAEGVADAEMKAVLRRQHYDKETIESTMSSYAKAAANKVEEESIESLTADKLIEKLVQDGMNQDDAESLVFKASIITTNYAESESIREVTEETVKKALVQGVLTKEQAKVLLGTMANTSANNLEAASWKLLTSRIKENIVAMLGWMATNPIGQIVAIGAAIGAVLFAISHAYKSYQKSIEESKEATIEAYKEYEAITSEVETLEENLKSLQEQIDSLDPITDEEDIENLKSESEELERQLAILKEKQELEKKEAHDAAVNSLGTTTTSKYKKTEMSTYDANSGQNIAIEYYAQVTQQEELDAAVDYYKELEKKKAEIQEQMIVNGDVSSPEWQQLNQQLIDIDEEMINVREDANALAFSLEDQSKALDTTTKEGYNLNKSIDGTIDKYHDLIDSLDKSTDALNKNTEAQNQNLSVADSRMDMISNLNNMSEGFEELDKIYESIKDEDPFDFKLLDDKAFKDTFSGLGDVYADFIETITSNPDDIKACQSAFDDLLTAWINSDGVLNDVTDANKNLTISMLDQMGVANAEEVVIKALMRNRINEKLATYDLTDANLNLTDSIYKELSAYNLSQDVIADVCNAYSKAQSVMTSAINSGANARLKKMGIELSAIKSYADALAAVVKSTGYTYQQIGEDANVSAAVNNSDYRYILQMGKALDKASAAINTASKTNVSYSGGSTSNKSSSGSGSSKSDTSEEFDWIERAVKKVKRTIDNLGKTVAATYKKWTTRNTALKDQISAINSEISIQQKAYDYYMSKANSLGLSSTYVNKIKDGSISVETITNESLKEKIQEYQELYDKAIDAQDAITDLRDEIADLAQQKFDNVNREFENKLVFLNHEMEMIESAIDLVEAKGYVVGKSYYEELNKRESEHINLLKQQRASLQKEFEEALKTGQIEQYSEAWYELSEAILDVDKSIADANQSLVDIQNSMRELEWEAFDKMQELSSMIQSESDFYIDLMSNKKLVDDNGNFTDQGQTSLGLHTVNYNAYMAQADKYAKEIEDINKELAKDPNNQTLLERRNELLESQRDMISSAEDEKQAIKSLYEEGYNALLDSLGKLIDKRKELLSVTEDLYDYEKNINEQTKEIARLEKIMASFSGMETEESKAAIQKYKVELEEARTNLEETERDKYIQDQEKMLDELQSQTEEWVNQRLDNIDGLLSSAIESTNQNSDAIRETLETEAENVGITLTENMNTIWGENGSFTSVVSEYGNNFSSQLTTVNNTLANIQNYVSSMADAANKEANVTVGGISSSTNAVENTKAPITTPSSSSSSSSTSGSGSSSSSSSVSKPQVSAISGYLKYGSRGSDVGTLQKALNMIQGSGLKVDNIFGTKTQAALKTFQRNNGVSQDGILGPKTKAKFKAKGYAKGSERIRENQVAITNEAGQEIIYSAADGSLLTPLRKGDKVFENEAVQRLWDISHNSDFTDAMLRNASIPSIGNGVISKPVLQNISNSISNTMSGDMNFHIEMNGVNDPQQFAVQLKHELLYNKDVNKIVQNSALGTALGKNSLSKFNYR